MHKVKFSKLYSRFCNQEYRENFNNDYHDMLNDIKNQNISLRIEDYVKVYPNFLSKNEISSFIILFISF